MMTPEQLQKAVDTFDQWRKTTRKNYLNEQGVYDPNAEFMAFLKDKDFEHEISDAAQAREFAAILKTKCTLENADSLNLSLYTDEQLDFAIEESQIDLEEIRKVADEFERWRKKQDRTDFFEPNFDAQYKRFSPHKALLLFVEKTSALKSIKNYAGFCQLTEYVKIAGKIDVFHTLKSPSERTKFDLVCTNKIKARLLGITNHSRFQAILLFISMLVTMYRRDVARTSTLNCGNVSIDDEVVSMTCQVDSRKTLESLVACTQAGNVCEQSFQATDDPYVMNMQLWKDSISSQPVSSATFCSSEMFWTCASKKFDGNYTQYKSFFVNDNVTVSEAYEDNEICVAAPSFSWGG